MTFRICASLILYNQAFYQSYAFNEKKFLGNIQTVYDSLERKKVDEIHVIRARKEETSQSKLLNDLNLLENVSTMTPVAIGGGISENTLTYLRNISFERFILNKSLFEDINFVKSLLENYGLQSVCAYLPFRIKNDNLFIWNGSVNKFIEYNKDTFDKFADLINEYIFLDAESEGTMNGFDFRVFDKIALPFNKILISGGITSKCLQKSKNSGFAGVSIDNRSLYYERDFLL